MGDTPDIVEITATADLPAEHYGVRAHVLAGLVQKGLPVPTAFAVSVAGVHKYAVGEYPENPSFNARLVPGALYSVRRSPVQRAWGGPRAILNIGMNFETRDILAKTIGLDRANDLYCRFVRSFAIKVARLDEDDIEELVEHQFTNAGRDYGHLLSELLQFYRDELDEVFPQNPHVQMQQVLRAMALMWEGTTARILRSARGAPADAGIGLIVQDMAQGACQGECGSGIGQFVTLATGAPGAHGRYKSESQGHDAVSGRGGELYLGVDPRGPSLEETAPKAFAQLRDLAAKVREIHRDDVQLQFTVQDDKIWILDAKPAERSGRAEVAIAVRLVQDGLRSKPEALMSIAPRSLTEMLHRHVDPKAKRERILGGIPASPGAAFGHIVFSANAVQTFAAREEPCILVRPETTPEDIRGMQSAQGVLTQRGGMTSHAAVIARGLGVPCIVGAVNCNLDIRKKTMTLEDGTILREGDMITLDGTEGEVLRGAVNLVEPDFDGPFTTFMDWADEFRRLGIRGNVDTPTDAHLARGFNIDGVGLCRTEHMFFEPGRLTAMREMIFAEEDTDRQAALDRLLPMQRDDFAELFEVMAGMPVCIRLLDPPLHEFLPQTTAEMRTLAEAMDLPLPRVQERAEALGEVNPMLGMRGVRLGITVPGIYDMQARAIFEAAADVQKRLGQELHPEIMVPLVSASAEVALVKNRVETVAAEVERATGEKIAFTVGVMVETPRAALRAGEISKYAEFISFGTNDLTQMAYGLSRDDAGRFMRDYVNMGVFGEDPFHSIDVDGVGELVLLAVQRARARNPGMVLGLCGEHGGDPESVAFCHKVGLDYVSCSAYRTPIARLAAAQAAIQEMGS